LMRLKYGSDMETGKTDVKEMMDRCKTT